MGLWLNVGACASFFLFFILFLCFHFSRSLRAIERQRETFGPSFTLANIIKVIYVIKLMLQEGRRSPKIIWLYVWFSSICFDEISNNVHSLCKSFKSKKIYIYKVRLTLCFLPISQIWSHGFFLSTCRGTRKATNMFNGPANLRKFHRRKCDKSYSKDPYFLCRKILTSPRSVCEYA